MNDYLTVSAQCLAAASTRQFPVVDDGAKRIQGISAASPVRVSQQGGNVTVGLSRELPQFDFVEIGETFAANDKDQVVQQLLYNPDDHPPDLFVPGPALQYTADPQRGLYLKGERHLAYFHAGAGQRIPIPGVLFHLGKTSAKIDAADPTHPEQVASGPVAVWKHDDESDEYETADRTLTVYDWLGQGIESGTPVVLFLHNQSRRWYAIPQSATSSAEPQVRWGVCAANWTYTGGIYPSQGGHARVSVQECDDSNGTNPHGENLVVYLPNSAKGDPNLVAGDVIAFALAANGTPVCVSSYMDDPIGTVKMFTGTSAQVRPGWACMGGGNESKHLNGVSWNMEDKFARHSCSDGKVGTTGGNETHDHGGLTGAAGGHNHSGNTADATTEIRVYDPNSGVGPTQSQHRPHNHEVTLEGGTAEAPVSEPISITGANTVCTSTERDGAAGGCGYDTTLSHAVDDPGHHHEISSDGDHAHAIPADTHLPPYRYLRFIERVDNSG